MPFVGIIFIILSSVLTGTLITAIFRERNTNYVVKFATGFLSLFVFLLLAVLVSLKLDYDLNRLSIIYLGIVSAASMLSIPVLLKEGINKPGFFMKKESIPYVIFAVLIGFVSFVILSQSFVNDDTLEIVTTSLTTNSVYRFSSLTGNEMINGLPIYNKVYVVPMFYTTLCNIFGLNRFLMILVIVPATVYITNILLVSQIADFLPVKSKSRFMIFYLVLLLCGTYLPEFGIPITAGYAILRQGYSGYAIIYGILIPLVVLHILKKKYVVAVLYFGFSICLFKIDRVLYTVLDLFNTIEKSMTAGKLAVLFFVAVFAMWIISKREETKADYRIVIMPMAFVAYVVCVLTERFETKKTCNFYFAVAIFTAFACVNFQPAVGAELLPSYVSDLNSVSTCIETLRKENADIKLYGSLETMTYARVCSDNTTVLYGRDFNTSYLLGTDYEVKSEYISDYDKLMKNIYQGFEYLVTSESPDVILKNAADEGVNAIIISAEVNTDYAAACLSQSEFVYKGQYGEFAVYGRY